ncbi:hypothetical protein [Weissella paramesenteroides]|uniref:hypothetical protein n=1 Tax=Weissella paramesenteroides TaxID=1249 RepID=UPI002E7B2898|nr:hypothetical protein [Weissella paramesenteroides]WPQ68418.1 hypothetical protein QRX23_02135 [Weissella paramesenteroides]
MREFTKEDKAFLCRLIDAYNDEQIKTVLVMGFDDDDKFMISLISALKAKKNAKVQLRVNLLDHTKELVQRAFDQYSRNTKVVFNTKKPFNIFGHKILVDQWRRNSSFPIYNDISIYYPVQSVIDDGSSNDFKKFFEALSNDHSKLRILVTTNDVTKGYLKLDLLSGVVDKIMVLDSSKKFPEQYSIILNNLNEDRIYYENFESDN